MIRRLLDNFRVAFLRNKPGILSVRDDTQIPLATNATHDNSIQDSTSKSWWQVIFITSLCVTLLGMGTRKLGWLQRWELRAYDQMMLMRPPEAQDDRILLVTVTQEDLQKYPNSLRDETINQLLAKIQSYQPRVIGLNIKRPQQTNLAAGIHNDNIITACVFATKFQSEIPPPPKFPQENIAFSDLIPDTKFDNVVRLGLLVQTPYPDGKCNTKFSFSSELAIRYLSKQKIDLHFKDDIFHLGNVAFPRLTKNSGAYIKLDDKGYQILINYRNHRNVAKNVSLTQVLTGKVNPDLIKDRLVIIGKSVRMLGVGNLTPYSSSKEPTTVPYIVIHAQIASQLISAVLDKRSLIWYFPEWLEVTWIWSWSIIGGALAWKARRPLYLLIVSGITVSGLIIICYGLIIKGGWVPVVPPGLALVFTAIGVLGYTTGQTQLQTKIILVEVEKQKEAIEQLNTLLKETTGIQDAPRIQPLAAVAVSTSSSSLLSNRYKVTRVLAQGGFGCTYLAQDTQRPGSPTCVVKQLMPARKDARFLQVARRLFNSEAEILELLGKHHQVPELYAFFEEDQEFYLVQQFIPGYPLTEELPPNKNIRNESDVINMLVELLEVLAFIHQRQVIHRDIKPANIIRCNQDNRLVLIDFGAVKLMQPRSKEQTELATIAIGTHGYTPPEQFAGHPRLSSDIYAVGAIAIQSLTGLLPHELQPNPDTGNIEWREWAQVSDTLATILDKMMRYDASERYKSAVEALEDIKSVSSE